MPNDSAVTVELAEDKNGKLVAYKSLTVAEVPQALGLPREDGSPRTLLIEFLDWLEGKARPTQDPKQLSPLTGGGRTAAVKSAGAPKRPPKPVNQGQQNRRATLRRRGETWVAIFEGDDREAVILNAASIPATAQDGQIGEFYVTSASKRGGIQVRFERLKK
jgi:hypothetical protein